MTPVYKICSRSLWREAEATGRFDGSLADRADGFIHLSTAEQLPGTLAGHFAGEDDLLIVAFTAEGLGGALRWERSRRGALFPHFYGPFPANAALHIMPLTLRADGRHHLPELA